MFTIYPAIDLRNGRVVRLLQGDPSQQITYSDNPAAVAKRWVSEGATWLHVVNLDGAFGDHTASRANRRALQDLCCCVRAKIQFGGGLRDINDVKAAFDAGADRVVLGTAAVENPRLVADALAQFGAERVAVGLDSRDGIVVTRGWQQTTQMTAIELGSLMKEMGVVHALYTEVGRDGMLAGVAAELTAALAQLTGLKVIASGGVRNLDDIRELLQYAPRGVEGVIVGRALYEGALSLREALQAVVATEQP
ncbi:MAG: 1-(5-phosphoribosyl)-5-[(5-phosphoribosylamino)methylideneamino]imidazole-4-carboxamide isomerase [Thermoflexales bacterium]|nr:1-(5-phosphoribosyl)-5-[(5-phosphoribosylamino)methylideneamino]imidazole-4-carboxamide isomerase [Thermoflexales bacterium]MDW8350940.1 1-(5-phosphoribosyl)-5-[(5-phosphoribosylamino)methylideneamino]imidazole-4-carboxamide isomerase [Anaerolineae bacterium]